MKYTFFLSAVLVTLQLQVEADVIPKQIVEAAPLDSEIEANRGTSSAVDENQTNDGSHYGRRMFLPSKEGKADKELNKFVKDNGARFIVPVATQHNNFDIYDSFFPWNSLKGSWEAAKNASGSPMELKY
ncbi:MAG: hypothetical protein ACSHX0_04270 [Akkermansiaceae bacterium]